MPITRINPTGTEYSLRLTDFSGGVNNKNEPDQIADNELADVDNYVLGNPDSNWLTKRPGLGGDQSTAQTENIVLIYEGEHDEYFCTLTTIRNDAGTSLDSGLTSSANWDATTFNNFDIFVNGTEERKTSDGSTFAAVGGTPPNFTTIEAHNQFLFGAGHADGRLRWSELGDEDTWTATNELIITDQQNNDITALKSWRGVLFVFTERSFFHVNGFKTTDMGVVHSEFAGPGCTSPRSVVTTNFGIFWWSNQGLVFSRNGVTTDLPMQRKIPTTFESLDSAEFSRVHGVWDPREQRVIYWASSTAGNGQPDIYIFYYYNRDAFFLGSGSGDAQYISASGTYSRVPYVGNPSAATNTHIFRFRQGTDRLDNGNAISSSLVTKRFYPANEAGFCRHASTRVLDNTGLSHTTTLDWWLDSLDSSQTATDSFSLTTLNTSGTNARLQETTKSRRKFNSIQFGVSDSTNVAANKKLVGLVSKGYQLSA